MADREQSESADTYDPQHDDQEVVQVGRAAEHQDIAIHLDDTGNGIYEEYRSPFVCYE